MKKLLNRIRRFFAISFAAILTLFTRPKLLLANKRGENFLDSGFKILIVVVLASLLLTALYVLFADLIMPMLTDRVTELFNYGNSI